MTVEVRPLGAKCNIQCKYCYQHPIRDAGNVLHSYDIEKMKVGIEQEGSAFTLFGGEALMIPEKDLEEIWSWGFKKYGRNGIQTNGTLINDNHIRMFKKYKVNVGISVDGPEELNDVRWAGSIKRTRHNTAKTHAAIKRLCQEGIPPSLIVTLHRYNATKDKLPIMHDWFKFLEDMGITSARLHILEVENEPIRKEYALNTEECIKAFINFTKLENELTTLKFDVFKDMRNMLLGQDNRVTCIWNACDPYTTRAVRGMEGTGQRTNCGRSNKDGIEFVKTNIEGLERYLALYHTPQEHGGCKDCRFFLMCKGQCPGTAINGDWRNRTEHCQVWLGLYQHLEKQMLEEGLAPVSVHPNRQQVEGMFIDTWAAGHHANIASCLKRVSQGQATTTSSRQNSHGDSSHGDHTDHGDSSHGDSPHGDAHGDHTDHGINK